MRDAKSKNVKWTNDNNAVLTPGVQLVHLFLTLKDNPRVNTVTSTRNRAW
jgi:hypothetical protein